MLSLLVTSSIKDVENNLIIVYPNPANQFIEIPLYNSQEAILKIYDVTGKMLSQTLIQSNNKTYQFDINYLSKGMYLLQISSENKKYHSSFIKQ